MNIAIIGGGNSGEREVSLKSLDNICSHLMEGPYVIYKLVLTGSKIEHKTDSGASVFVDLNDFSLTLDTHKINFDFVYNTIHGSPGENGFLQGYLDLLGIPYNSCNVLVSAITFNKQICKYVLQSLEGINLAKSKVVTDFSPSTVSALASMLSLPLFVKPNKGGSSVGISKVNRLEDLSEALEKAFKEDNEVLVEEFIQGTEITCGVVRKNNITSPIAVTEISFESEFFDYNAKYLSNTTQEITPARIPEVLYQECMQLSARVYDFLDCKGIIRIDYILKQNQLYLIEVNTIPGMSKESIIPRQIKHSNQTIKDFVLDLIKV